VSPRLTDEQKRDQERLRRIRKIEERSEPKFQKPRAGSTYLLLLFIVAIVCVAAYFIFTHKEQFLGLFKRAPKPAAEETEEPLSPDNRF
jgi:hypothetical protein